MNDSAEIIALSNIITLALAPAFLLVGVGSFLNVLSLRLGRIIDRARLLESAWRAGPRHEPLAERGRRELLTLDRRLAVVHWSISVCTAAALFICVLIATLFLGDLGNVSLGLGVALLFILVMALLILGLILFLVEIYLATRSVRVSRELLRGRPASDD